MQAEVWHKTRHPPSSGIMIIAVGSQALEQMFADCLGIRVASDLGGDEKNQLYARESVRLCHCIFVFALIGDKPDSHFRALFQR